jgi:16S rRNA (guanine527-N7)-methyltransferase
MPELIDKYFPGLTEVQKEKFEKLLPLYGEWNSRINLISRKDMDNFYLHHVLHSLSISRIATFMPGTKILDVGTGGGFPGIPLAILFPEVNFTLCDSIEKKIKVVTAVSEGLALGNVIPLRSRAEEIDDKFDFVISRAVSAFPDFVKLTSGKVKRGGMNPIANGIICLKGGDLSEELQSFRKRVIVWKIDSFFSESFFETKQIVYLPF